MPVATAMQILIVEDNPGDADLLRLGLRKPKGAFAVTCAETLAAARRELASGTWDAVLLDLGLPDAQGLEALETLLGVASGVPIVVVTGNDDEATALTAVQSGAQDYLVKGLVSTETLPRVLRYACERQAAQLALRESQAFLHESLDALNARIGIVGDDGKLHFVNLAWQAYGEDYPHDPHGGLPGTDYLARCDAAGDQFPCLARLASGIRAVLSRDRALFETECRQGEGRDARWFTVRVTPFPGSVRPRVAVAFEEVTALKEAEEQLKRVANVLRGVRNVNQLITKEKDRQRLIAEACEVLTEALSYGAAWIALLDPDGQVVDFAGSGPGVDHEALRRRLVDEQRLTACCQEALAASRPVVHRGNCDDCPDCATLDDGSDGRMSAPLHHQGRTYGVLTVSLFAGTEPEQEEVGLFAELADDIAFALQQCELAEDHRRNVRKLAFHSQILSGIHDHVVVTDLDGRMTYVNDVACRNLGYAREQMLGQSVDMLGEVPDEGATQQEIVQATRDHGHWRGVVTNIRADGSRVLLDCRTALLRDEAGQPFGMTGISTDITEQVATQRALDRSQRALRLQNAVAQVFLTAEPEVTYPQSLALVCAALGSSHGLFGHLDDAGTLHCAGVTTNAAPTLLQLDSEQQQGAWAQALRTATSIRGDDELALPDGMSANHYLAVPIRHQDATVGLLLVAGRERPFHDEDAELLTSVAAQAAPILHARRERERQQTAQEHLEGQLRQSQKMEAVGRLAGGVAHDFNNMLTVIMGHAQMMARKLKDNDPLARHVGAIDESAGRATNLTRQLLAFSRKQTLEPVVINLNDIVTGIEPMLRRLIGEDLDMVVAHAPNLANTLADPSQVEQILMNLAINARDAMPDGGKLTIETANVELDQEYANRHAEVEPGHYVMLAVTDTGIGMDRETIEHIFEPFFSTKEVGRGTGLGLSTVYGIVQQSGGHIWVYSEPGQGCTFKVYLRRCLADQAAPLQLTPVPTEMATGQFILVVEDEPGLRELADEMLTSLGYRVRTCANAGEALLAIEEGHLRPDLLLTDVIMPGMSGAALAQRVQQTLPELPVLYMSGYTENAIVHHGVLDPGIPYLQKPFSLNRLAAKVQEVLRTAANP